MVVMDLGGIEVISDEYNNLIALVEGALCCKWIITRPKVE